MWADWRVGRLLTTSALVQWLGSHALTVMARVRFPDAELPFAAAAGVRAVLAPVGRHAANVRYALVAQLVSAFDC